MLMNAGCFAARQKGNCPLLTRILPLTPVYVSSTYTEGVLCKGGGMDPTAFSS